MSLEVDYFIKLGPLSLSISELKRRALGSLEEADVENSETLDIVLKSVGKLEEGSTLGWTRGQVSDDFRLTIITKVVTKAEEGGLTARSFLFNLGVNYVAQLEPLGSSIPDLEELALGNFEQADFEVAQAPNVMLDGGGKLKGLNSGAG